MKSCCVSVLADDALEVSPGLVRLERIHASIHKDSTLQACEKNDPKNYLPFWVLLGVYMLAKCATQTLHAPKIKSNQEMDASQNIRK